MRELLQEDVDTKGGCFDGRCWLVRLTTRARCTESFSHHARYHARHALHLVASSVRRSIVLLIVKTCSCTDVARFSDCVKRTSSCTCQCQINNKMHGTPICTHAASTSGRVATVFHGAARKLRRHATLLVKAEVCTSSQNLHTMCLYTAITGEHHQRNNAPRTVCRRTSHPTSRSRRRRRRSSRPQPCYLWGAQ